MGRAGGSGSGRAGGGHSFGGGHSGGGRSSFGGGRNSSGGSTSRNSSGGLFSSKPSRSTFGSKPSEGNSFGGGGFFFNNKPPKQTTRTIIINNSNNSTHSSDDRTYNNSSSSITGLGCGFLAFIVVMALLITTVICVGFLGGKDDSSSDITISTVEREPLPAGSVNETEYYTDELKWIGNKTELEKGMKNFYKETGVQPYLYITDNVNGEHITDEEQLADYSELLYQNLFTDEAHMLLVFYEYDGDYADYYLCGSQAKTVIDREAGDILLDYVDKYYYNEDITDEEFFSTVFDKTAIRIMTVEKSPWPKVWMALIILMIIIVIAVFLIKRKEQKIKEAEQDAKILETPLEEFGDDDELEELKKKYEDTYSKE
nr:hypothetical protein [uncultured Aminipila sp.]